MNEVTLQKNTSCFCIKSVLTLLTECEKRILIINIFHFFPLMYASSGSVAYTDSITVSNRDEDNKDNGDLCLKRQPSGSNR